MSRSADSPGGGRRPRRRPQGKERAREALSPAQRMRRDREEYAAYRAWQNDPPQPRAVEPGPEAMARIAEFSSGLPYPLDAFQVEAAAHLAAGRSVLVAAPTGTGKTVVAEFAIWQTRRAGQRAIYTAPVKALSNQKFRDLRALYGEREVGLLTGDIAENPRAPIVVMTTEIYRNMLLEGLRAGAQGDDVAEQAPPADRTEMTELARRAALDRELSQVGCVIFDELHFLSDPERGPVWEEAIIHSPPHVIFVGLSATVSNADELRRWIEHVHGPMDLVFHDARAVPLQHYYFLDEHLHLVQDATGKRVERFPQIGGEAKLARMRNRVRRYVFEGETERPPRVVERGDARRTQGRPSDSAADATTEPVEEATPERTAPEPGEVLRALRAANLLPCLYFLPGRRAVEAAAASAASHLLTSPERRAHVQQEVQAWVQALPTEDQRLDQVRRLLALLPRGLGFHHAGMLPALKVLVETLFARGDLRAVFATDTLALGINMPARSVVVGSLSKFDGTQMRQLTPNEYQQLTGRAGRRGMDASGAAVIPYSPWDAFEPAFSALTAPLLPVISAFSVRYNTVLNLWRPNDLSRLRTAVAASLREFQRRGRRSGGRFATEFASSHAQRRPRDYGLSRHAAMELNATIYVLRALGYINGEDALSIRGRLLRALFHQAGIVVAELLFTDALDGLAPAEVAEVFSWFTFDGERLRNLYTLPQRLTQARRAVYEAQRLVQELEYSQGIQMSPTIVDAFFGVALNWARGTSLAGIQARIDLAEGDLLVILNQTIDALQQVQAAVGQVLDARDLWQPGAAEDDDFLVETHARLTRLRPTLAQAWQSMLRGSVALSRAIPSMATPGEPEHAPALAMAEDEDPAEVALDRDEQPRESGD